MAGENNDRIFFYDFFSQKMLEKGDSAITEKFKLELMKFIADYRDVAVWQKLSVMKKLGLYC